MQDVLMLKLISAKPEHEMVPVLKSLILKFKKVD